MTLWILWIVPNQNEELSHKWWLSCNGDVCIPCVSPVHCWGGTCQTVLNTNSPPSPLGISRWTQMQRDTDEISARHSPPTAETPVHRPWLSRGECVETQTDDQTTATPSEPISTQERKQQVNVTQVNAIYVTQVVIIHESIYYHELLKFSSSNAQAPKNVAHFPKKCFLRDFHGLGCWVWTVRGSVEQVMKKKRSHLIS
jgi:hypothetical protein